LIIIGVDPAPSKPSTICLDGETFIKVPPDRLKIWVRQQVETHEGLLIAWDAPLSFNPANGYSDRPIDKAVRAFIKTHKARIAAGAVSVLPFSGCPHWAITSDALGLPLSDGTGTLSLIATPITRRHLTGAYAIEVHPAVTLALWWLDINAPGPMLRYKPGGKLSAAEVRQNRGRLVEMLSGFGLPSNVSDDDEIDAWVAWRMAEDFSKGDAVMIGDSQAGSYVLPSSAISHWRLDQAVAATQTGPHTEIG